MGIRDFFRPAPTAETPRVEPVVVEQKAVEIHPRELAQLIMYGPDASAVNANYVYARDVKEALKNPIVRKALSAITQAATQPRWELYFADAEVEEAPAEPLAGIWAFLQRPNEQQSLNKFIAEYIYHIYLAGEAFVWMFPDARSFKNGVGKLYLIDPSRVTFDKTDYVIDGKKRIPMVNKDGTREILHIRDYAFNSARGESVLVSAWSSVLNQNMALKFNSSILNNSARMSIVANFKQSGDGRTTLDKEQLKDLNNDVARFASPEGRGKPLVVSGDWNFQEFGQSNRDLDWLEGMNAMSRNIALSFNLAPAMLSLPGDSTYNNVREANAALFNQVAMPRLAELIESLEHWLRDYIPGDWELRINKDDISALEIERESLWNRAGGKEALTVDERRALIGYEPMEEVAPPVEKEEPTEEPISDEETEKETNDE